MMVKRTLRLTLAALVITACGDGAEPAVEDGTTPTPAAPAAPAAVSFDTATLMFITSTDTIPMTAEVAARADQRAYGLMDRDELGAGMVSFKVDGIDAIDLQGRLARRANIRTRVIGEYDYRWMRLSPHIYNSPAELDLVLELIRTETV